MAVSFSMNPNLVQIQQASQAANTTTGSTTFVTLLTINITTNGGNLNYFASICSSNNGTTNFNAFRIQLDGVTVTAGAAGTDGGSLSAANVQRCVSLVGRSTGVAAGAHTVTLQWRTSGGTARIAPVTVPDQESAVLQVSETRV